MRDTLYKRTLFVFLPLTLITGFILTLTFGIQTQKSTHSLEVSERQAIKSLNELTSLEFRNLLEDLLALSQHHELEKYLEHSSEEIIDDIHNDWGAFQERREIYDQVRFIESIGQEQIRLNLSNNNSVAVSKDVLQNKSNRYCFQNTMALYDGQVFVSPLDLNVENGKVKRPICSAS